MKCLKRLSVDARAGPGGGAKAVVGAQETAGVEQASGLRGPAIGLA